MFYCSSMEEEDSRRDEMKSHYTPSSVPLSDGCENNRTFGIVFVPPSSVILSSLPMMLPYHRSATISLL
jgi:hypothetical protein